MNKKIRNILAFVLLICIDLLIIPMLGYYNPSNLFTLWFIIPFEIVHTVPFMIVLDMFEE